MLVVLTIGLCSALDILSDIESGSFSLQHTGGYLISIYFVKVKTLTVVSQSWGKQDVFVLS